MRTRFLPALAALSLAMALSACGNTTAVDPGGNNAHNTGNGAAGISDTQQEVADRVAAADQAAAALTQVLGPAAGAMLAVQAQSIAASARTLQAADEALEECLGAGSVQISLQVNPLAYVVTVTNGLIFGDTVPVNGTLTITASRDSEPRVLTVTTAGFTVGQCTVSGTMAMSSPASGNSLAVVANDLVVAWQDKNSTAGFDLNATVTEAPPGVYVLTGTLVVSTEGIPNLESAEVAATASDLTVTATSFYPTAGTLTFMCEGQELSIAFSGGTTATVSDGQGHSATVPLPPLV